MTSRGVGQAGEDRGDLALVGPGELRQRGAATRVLDALARLDEPQQHPPGEKLLPGIERLERAVRRRRDRGPHTARAAIGVER